MLNIRSSDPVSHVAQSLQIDPQRVATVVRLLADGNTVPFIARYRKEVTGALDEVQLRAIAEQHTYQVDLGERRQTVIKTIDEAGKLTDALRSRIENCTTKTELEDLYAPFRPKRRTRATTAREKGLEPLAMRILAQSVAGDPEVDAKEFVNAEKGVADVAAALQGARDIIAEQIADDADLRTVLRSEILERGQITASKVGEDTKSTKFDEYFDFKEPIKRLASHRYLALRRGERQKALRLQIELDDQTFRPRMLAHVQHDPTSPYATQLERAVDDSYQRLLLPSVSTTAHVELKMRADRTALDVFAKNLEGILLASPLGAKPVLGIDPGIRTGCKCAAVDATGKLIEHTTIQPFRDEASKQQANETLADMTRRLQPFAVAIGNGTAGRETELFTREALHAAAIADVIVLPVNEAGASVYSASDIAREEFPDIDVTIRGAVSIARRLQDPLAELVKIEPKSIGVGQYQHDIHQPLLKRKLDEVVESCVNRVGVEVATASAALLAHVAGIGPKLAKNIVSHRETHGGIASRAALREIPGVGDRTFEQAAGFLRVRGSSNPLDASAVHPERYPLVEQMAQDLGVSVAALVGNEELAGAIDVSRYIDDAVGEPTLKDIIAELRKPGRDPRDTFDPPRFRDDVNKLEDLKVGMELEGVVTNVTAFGAFVDVGVHQDGLVHVSQLAERFVADPSQVVKVGSRLTVRVLSVDPERRRISLTARKAERPKSAEERPRRVVAETGAESPRPQRDKPRGPRRERAVIGAPEGAGEMHGEGVAKGKPSRGRRPDRDQRPRREEGHDGAEQHGKFNGDRNRASAERRGATGERSRPTRHQSRPPREQPPREQPQKEQSKPAPVDTSAGFRNNPFEVLRKKPS